MPVQPQSTLLLPSVNHSCAAVKGTRAVPRGKVGNFLLFLSHDNPEKLELGRMKELPDRCRPRTILAGSLQLQEERPAWPGAPQGLEPPGQELLPVWGVQTQWARGCVRIPALVNTAGHAAGQKHA